MSEHKMKPTTPTQFIAAVLGSLAPVLIVVVLLVNYFMGIAATHITDGDPAAENKAVAERLKPVGHLVVGQAAAPAAGGAVDGKKVYDSICQACHASGAAGAPKAGDKAAWAPRLKAGMPALYVTALKGKGAMPAKGGNPNLSDAEVKAAVDYLAAQAK